jgi:hypothetical protein
VGEHPQAEVGRHVGSIDVGKVGVEHDEAGAASRGQLHPCAPVGGHDQVHTLPPTSYPSEGDTALRVTAYVEE